MKAEKKHDITADYKDGVLFFTAANGVEIDPLEMKHAAALVLAVVRLYEQNDDIYGFISEGGDSLDGTEYEIERTDDGPPLSILEEQQQKVDIPRPRLEAV